MCTTEVGVLSWNIDGLNQDGLLFRCGLVCDAIKDVKPHVVLLQEVVNENLEVLKRKLGKQYQFFYDKQPPMGYFVVILLEKTIKQIGDLKIVNYPKSCMGRQFISVDCSYQGHTLTVGTTHLESTKNYGEERKSQAEIAINSLKEGEQSLKIIAGDFNIREAEVKHLKKTGVWDDLQDSWEVCGKDKGHKFTWDLQLNTTIEKNPKFVYTPRFRFDRMWFSTQNWKAKSFMLLGTSEIEGYFPSDHFAIFTNYGCEIGDCTLAKISQKRKLEENADGGKEETPKMNKMPKKQCGKCTYINPAIFKQCEMCQSVLGKAEIINEIEKDAEVVEEQVSKTSEEWICSKCTLINPSDMLKCGVCMAEKVVIDLSMEE